MFLSRRPHRSLRTPPDMKKVYKLVLFYKFAALPLSLQYNHVAPPALLHTTPRTLSVLPSQERTIRKTCRNSFEECKHLLAKAWMSSTDAKVVLVLDIEPKGKESVYGAPVYGVGAEVSIGSR